MNEQQTSILHHLIALILLIYLQTVILNKNLSWKILNFSLICISILWLLLLSYLIIKTLIFKNFMLVSNIIVLIGGGVSILLYKMYLNNYSGDGTHIHRFILGPYLLSIVLSFVIWFLILRSDRFQFLQGELVQTKIAWVMRRLAKFSLNIIAALFIVLSIYMLWGLKIYLLSAWALFTGCCAFGCAAAIKLK